MLKALDKGNAALDRCGRLFLDRFPESFEVILMLLQGYHQHRDSLGLTWAGIEVGY